MTVANWSTTAALNVLDSGVAGSGGTITLDGSVMTPSQVDDAFRSAMAQLATWFTDANFTLTSTDAGATVGPTLTLYRNSASPAVNDIIGRVLYQGEDSAGNTQDYAEDDTQITDPTSASEDAIRRIRIAVAGTMTTAISFASTGNASAYRLIPTANDGAALGATTLSWSDLFLASGGVINWNNGDITLTQSAGALAMTYTDAGALIGPSLDLFRDSASPAASDIIGSVDFNGRDSAANKQLYARIHSVITDPTSTSEDASLKLSAVTAGTLTEIMSMTGASITMTGSVADKTWNQAADTDSIAVYGGNTTTTGGMLQLYGASHATEASNYKFRTANTVRYAFDHSTLQHQFTGAATVSGVSRFGQNTTDGPGNGNNTVGAAFDTGNLRASTAGTHTLNRTADGNVIAWNSGGTAQGVVSIAGATVTYGAFFGSHWSQLADGSKPAIFRGTIVETIDQMCEWPGEGPEERLPCFKISDTAGSRSVYGVFAWWEIWDGEGEPPTNDAYIGSLGAYVIRIAKGVIVQRGDYIESNGDGCGRVQADDILRASTVAKVTSTTVVETYPDGSYLVPATLHCG